MTARPLVPMTRVVRRVSQKENLVLRARDTVCTEARVINTEVRFHVRLKHSVICLLVTARAYIVRRIALLFLLQCSKPFMTSV